MFPGTEFCQAARQPAQHDQDEGGAALKVSIDHLLIAPGVMVGPLRCAWRRSGEKCTTLV
jgi:hypothetical protein